MKVYEVGASDEGKGNEVGGDGGSSVPTPRAARGMSGVMVVAPSRVGMARWAAMGIGMGMGEVGRKRGRRMGWR